ncbi:FxSxx-COOH protein [Frankia sp. Ag45/Mut15]|uniref:FxSxx-COOH protein n=1 Tax=Frankia umida TaxID=573489 RepID=A0ABT0K2C3_9ACTN|nr:FxSxx-COOH cyclophane-containing RiPP peptide [Frankia umida]MCK9877674.1 FxSxx-COOH protein [Frankia umida]
MTGLSLEKIMEVGGPQLGRALLRLCREASGAPPRYSGFNSIIRSSADQQMIGPPPGNSGQRAGVAPEKSAGLDRGA